MSICTYIQLQREKREIESAGAQEGNCTMKCGRQKEKERELERDRRLTLRTRKERNVREREISGGQRQRG